MQTFNIFYLWALVLYLYGYIICKNKLVLIPALWDYKWQLQYFFLVSSDEIHWSQNFSVSAIVDIVPEFISLVDLLQGQKMIGLGRKDIIWSALYIVYKVKCFWLCKNLVFVFPYWYAT